MSNKYKLDGFLSCFLIYIESDGLIKRESETMLCPNTSEKDEFMLVICCCFYNSFIHFFDEKIAECDDILKKTLTKAKDNLIDVYEFCKKNSLTLAQKKNYKGKSFNEAYEQLFEGIKKQYVDNQILSKAEKAWKTYLSIFDHFKIGNEYEIYEDEEDEESGEKCICNHKIHKIYNYVYKPLDVSIQVGSRCITKADPKNGEEIKKKHEGSIEQTRLKNKDCDQCIHCNLYIKKNYEIEINDKKFIVCNECKNLIKKMLKDHCRDTSFLKNEEIRGLIEDDRRNIFETFKTKHNNKMDIFKGYNYTYEKSFITDRDAFENYTRYCENPCKKIVFFTKEALNCIVQNEKLIYNDNRCKNCSSFLKYIGEVQSKKEFCSNNCSIDFNLKKNCNYCGETVYTNNDNFCSNECSKKSLKIKYNINEWIRYFKRRCSPHCSECKYALYDSLTPSEGKQNKLIMNDDKKYCINCQNKLMFVTGNFPKFLYFNIEYSIYSTNREKYKEFLKHATYSREEYYSWKIENVKKNDKYIKQLLEHNDFEINKQLTSHNSNNIMINDKLCLLSRYNLKKYYEDSSEIEMFVYEYLIEQFKYTDDDFVKELKSLELEEIEI